MNEDRDFTFFISTLFVVIIIFFVSCLSGCRITETETRSLDDLSSIRKKNNYEINMKINELNVLRSQLKLDLEELK